ncbi:MAG: hypothetical protein HRU27_18050 [Rhizobiaceae bacterium]|nr:hypothetical protein [Hyphomicrobiales bacterium]NRB32496.1 hypothetical protein [Rhizobiaceae bacterium]
MSMALTDFQIASGSKPAALSSCKYKTPRDCPRVTIRLSIEDHEKLKAQADGTALSVYLRALILKQQLPKRKLRSTASVEDRQAIAQLLALLGDSRIANNLNQLAYHANIGSLPIDDETKGQINEAYDHVLFIRNTLISALGMKP